MFLDLEAMMEDLSFFYPKVKNMAYHYYKSLLPWLDMDDLISAGMIGLLDAERKYDSSKGASFENYSYIRIDGEIRSELRKARGLKRSQINVKISFIPLSEIEGTGNEPYIFEDACIYTDIERAFNNLSDQERLIVRYSYLHCLSQSEIGRILGLGEQRVGKIHREALKKMAEYMSRSTQFESCLSA